MGVVPDEGTVSRPAVNQVVAAPDHYNKEMERALLALPDDIRVRMQLYLAQPQPPTSSTGSTHLLCWITTQLLGSA